MKITVMGTGGWGTALSQVLCDNGHTVTLWSHNPEKAEQLTRTRENPLLPGVKLPEALTFTGSMDQLGQQDLVVFATPSYAVRTTAAKAAPFLRPGTPLVSVSKGVERDTHDLMSQIIEEEVKKDCKVIALSGPSHAEEVGRRIPTGVVAAHPDEAAAQLVQDAFMNEYFRVYTSPDIIGVELAAALKNVVALSCGVIDGMATVTIPRRC